VATNSHGSHDTLDSRSDEPINTVLQWTRPENMHASYIPPLVLNNILAEPQFWDMAVHNTKLRIKEMEDLLAQERANLDHAKTMLTNALIKMQAPRKNEPI
jgi:hypothetical protein